MKRTLFMMLAVILALTACKKNETSSSTPTNQTSGTALPLKATAYIANNYPDAAITYYLTITNGPADYLVTLNTTEELAFNKAGDFLGRGENFHGGKPGDSIPCPGGGNGHHGGGIPVDSLPALLVNYVTANYSGFTIRHAEFDSICFNGLVVEVMLFKAGSEPVKLFFDPTGNYLMLANRTLYADVPQAVKDYVSANYAGYKAAGKAEKLTLADNSIQYNIFLDLAKTRKTARIDANGVFVCEQAGNGHGGNGDPGGHHGGIPVDSLPAAITGYITSSFAGYTIRHAEFDSLCPNGRVYEITIDKMMTPPVELYFDLATVFLMRADQVRAGDLPQAVKASISSGYTGFFPMKTEKLTLADGSVQYLVDLSKPHTMKTVRFAADGTVICER